MKLTCEQFRALVYYDFLAGLTVKECHNRIKSIFLDDAPTKATVNVWFEEFLKFYAETRADVAAKFKAKSKLETMKVEPKPTCKSELKDTNFFKYFLNQTQLIEAVRLNPMLYDTNHSDHMRVKLRNDIWRKIAKQVKLKNGEEARIVWVKLRHCHRSALRQQRQCQMSGTADSDIKLWKYQQQMEFLLPYMGNSLRETNVGDDNDIEDSKQLCPTVTETLDTGGAVMDSEKSS